jgi:hypothetical protein
MVYNGRFDIIKDEVVVLSIRNLAETALDWNL